VYRYFLKQQIDVALTLIGIIVLSPLILLLMVLVRLRLGSPIFFCQQRPGLHGKPFIVYKFRTMIDAFDENGVELPDSERLTAFGAWLRSMSLDELPTLFNVLRGEMSIVGPRPLLMHYLDFYTPEQARRHEVKPGITGWAQIHGRNTLPWDEKFTMDVWYVDHYSFGLDIKIILLTVWKVLSRQGINEEGQATVTQFSRK
jgi:sugar transferase EpsL